MGSQHERAVERALRANDEIGGLFGRLGHASAPRGALLRAYRTVLRELRGRLGDAAYVRAALLDFVSSVEAAARDVFRAAIDLGEDQGNDALGVWGIAPVSLVVDGEAMRSAVASVKANAERQSAGAFALVLSGADPSQILGDDVRVGVLQYASTFAESTRWAARLANASTAETMIRGTDQAVTQTGSRVAWGRQAIAALDLRTTDCCLRVHGQIAPLDGRFTLTGTPRFADEMDAPPFHYNCRTAIALVRMDALDEALSAHLRLDAMREHTAHEEGRSEQGKYASALLPA